MDMAEEVIYDSDLSRISKRNSGSGIEVVKRFKQNETGVSIEIDTHVKLRDIRGVVRLLSHQYQGTKELVMEFCSHGRLPKFMERRSYFTEEELLRHFRSMISTVGEMHLKRFVHRNITADNWLVDDNYEIKLSDFGYAKKINTDESGDWHSFHGVYTNCIFVQDARMLGVVFFQMATLDFAPLVENLTKETAEKRLDEHRCSFRIKEIVLALLFCKSGSKQVEVMSRFNEVHGSATMDNPCDVLLCPMEEELCSFCQPRPQRQQTGIRQLPCMHNCCSDCMGGCQICYRRLYVEEPFATLGPTSTIRESERYDDSALFKSFPSGEDSNKP